MEFHIIIKNLHISQTSRGGARGGSPRKILNGNTQTPLIAKSNTFIIIPLMMYRTYVWSAN
jgi:hypothetical protein